MVLNFINSLKNNRKTLAFLGFFIFSLLFLNPDKAFALSISAVASTTLDTTATITWTTDEASDSKVYYGTSAGGNYTSNAYSASSVTSHSVNLTGLTQQSRYYFIVVSDNGSGTISTSTEYTMRTFETWTARTDAGSRSWNTITSSSDGAKLAATPDSGYVYTSTDSGATWSTQGNSSGSRSWKSITSSSDGVKLAAPLASGYIYTSTSSGATWSTQGNSSGSRVWYGITSSSDGANLAAVVYGGYIYTSTSSGAVWTTNSDSSGSRNWNSITSSSDGTKLAATVYANYIYTSTDSGATWSTQGNSSGSRFWTAITSSSDGTKLAAAVFNASNSYIFTSTDSGATWATSTSAGSRLWKAITSSSDGTKLAAVVNGGYIYTSTDSGATWATSTSAGSRNWYGVTSSSDGTKIAAVVSSGYIYTSTLTLDLAPAITSISSSVSSTTATITWNTDEAASSSVSYGPTTSYGTVATSTGTTTHSVLLTDLSAGSTYNYSVLAIDASGNVSTSTNLTFTTTAPPPLDGFGHLYNNGMTGSGNEIPSNIVYINGAPTLVQATTTATTATTTVSTGTGTHTPWFFLTTPLATSTTAYTFVRNLRQGDEGEDVRQLQMYLNKEGFLVALSGAGSKGNETTVFGPLTLSAVIKFQKAKKIEPPVGFFGPITRGVVNGTLWLQK